MLAGFEIGGTKIVCALGPDPLTHTHRATLPTTTPEAVLPAMLAFLAQVGGVQAGLAQAGFAQAGGAQGGGRLRGIGIGSFGPLSLAPDAPDFGAILATPKPGWAGANLRQALARATGLPVGIDTDVNAAGLAEARFGAGQGLPSLAYVTIGTGIGGGFIRDGAPWHGLTHPEIGHIPLRRHALDAFPGNCPFHADCLEGLASGKALTARHGRRLADLPPSDPLWAIAADYLGQLCASLALTWCPHRIVLGGGVPADNPALLPPIRAATRHWLGDYLAHPAWGSAIATTLVPPALGTAAGIVGALILAEAASQAAAASAGNP